MNMSARTIRALKDLGQSLPDHSNIELCVLDRRGQRECHKFRVVDGVVHHSESHSHDFVTVGTGPLP